MILRDYQQNAIDQLYDWFSKNDTGHPVVVLPTGSGKSIVIASLVKDALQNWPETRVLMLTHVKELIEQNAEKMQAIWQDAPIGIFSASIGKKELTEPITFAGIQSIHKHSKSLGHVDLVLVDECHLINHAETGTYRKFLAELEIINPSVRIVGLTATPYRLGHGYITEGDDAIFSDLIEPISIEELVHQGYLAPLKSKFTNQQIDVSKVHKRGGEYIAGELEVAAQQANTGIVSETLERAKHCKSIIVFAAGVDHAETLKNEFCSHGISSACITGATPKKERERLIGEFKAGAIRVMTNANVLTTGFDYPDIDCVVLARPTMSPGLYVQMAGRGMRLKSHTDHCLVLDFAGCVAQHGPITYVVPPSKAEKVDGEAPIKTCPGLLADASDCLEILHASVMTCPCCGYVFPKKEKEPSKLHDDDIMGIAPIEMMVSEWNFEKYTSKQSGKAMLRVKYYGKNLSDPIVTEYFPVTHDGFAGDKARGMIAKMANEAKALALGNELETVAYAMNQAYAPKLIKYKRDGKFFRVLKREWL